MADLAASAAQAAHCTCGRYAQYGRRSSTDGQCANIGDYSRMSLYRLLLHLVTDFRTVTVILAARTRMMPFSCMPSG